MTLPNNTAGFLAGLTTLLIALTLCSHLAFHAPKSSPLPPLPPLPVDYERRIAALESRIVVLENAARVTHLRFERAVQVKDTYLSKP